MALAAALLALLVAPPLAGATAAPPVLTAFPAGLPGFGQFAESMAIDSHGVLYVSVTYYSAETNTGQIWRVTPDGRSRLAASLDLTADGQLMGVAVDDRDRVYVGLWDFSSLVGAPDTIGSGVFRLAGGTLTRVAALPPGTGPNGLAFHDGRLYISDPPNGEIWRVTPGAEASTTKRPRPP